VSSSPESTALAPNTSRWRFGRVSVLLAAAVFALVALAALWPELLATSAPNDVDPVNALAAPSAQHWFGTDQLGRDVYSRAVHGAGPSLVIGFGAVALALVVGALLGVFAASAGKAADEFVMRVTDIFLAFPGILLALVVVAVLGPGTANATLAIACSMAPGFVRLARGQALVIRESDYVRAAVVLGQGRTRIALRHVLPNALPPLLVFATINVATGVLVGSSLSFLGLGPRPPTAEWGAMLAESRDYLQVAWAMAVFPGVMLTVTVSAVTVLGRSLQRRFEGRHPVAGR
jgi:peptide/nickel transport system permease protein